MKKGGFKTKLIKATSTALLICTLIAPQEGSDHKIETQVSVSAEELDVVSNFNGPNTVLVNRNNPITREEMEKIDLVKTTDIDGNTVYLQRDALEAFTKLQEALQKDGYKIAINAGFRSYEDQENIYKELEAQYGKDYADEYTAPVGHSEHHTGLAIDVYMGRSSIFGKDIPLQINSKYQKTKEKMYEIMAEYGFILRYPEGKEDITGYPAEAWHIRYVGPELAKFLDEKNLTLEEFYEAINQYNDFAENTEENTN